MGRKVKTCECDGVCGARHILGCGVPSCTPIIRKPKEPGEWVEARLVQAIGGLDEFARNVVDYRGAEVSTSRVLPVGVRGKRVLLCTFCRHAWRARRAAEREEQRLARATRKPLYRRGVLR